jgi:hypothetical protein
MPVSQRKLAAALQCSQPYIAKLVKRGMPATSVAAAKKWRSGGGQKGLIGSRSKAFRSKPANPLDSLAPSCAVPLEVSESAIPLYNFDSETGAGAGLILEINQLRKTVAAARHELCAAMDVNSRAAATKNYAALLNVLRQFESDLPLILTRIGAVLDRQAVEKIWYASIQAFERQARTLPRRTAGWLIGQRDFHKIAEILDREVEQMLAAIIVDVHQAAEQLVSAG